MNNFPVSSTKLLQAATQSCRLHFIWAAVFSAMINLLYLAPTLYMLQVYDRVLASRGQITLAFLTLILVLALGSLSILDAVRARLFVRASLRLDRQLAGSILNATLGRTGSDADVLTRQAMREFDALRQTLTGSAALALFDAPWIPVYALVCFMLSPLLGLVLAVGGMMLITINLLNERATKSRLKQATEASNYAYVSQEQSAAGADVVRSLGMRQAMVARHLYERRTASKLQSEASFAAVGYLALMKFIRLLLQSLALGVGAWLAIEGKISTGVIFAASFLVGRALSPLEQILTAWRSLLQARTGWRNLGELLKFPSVAPMTILPLPQGALDVKQLVVMHPHGQSAILHGLSFCLNPGEILAIIGPSGAGKSCLLRALAGASSVYRGSIRFDGADTGDYDPERLASRIGYVPQDVTLFSGSVRDNISRFDIFKDKNLKDIDEAVIRAATACGAHDMILRLEDGYDTVLKWGGKGLSAGQAQRIALARALYGNPTMLLLDEPNAHLDSEGEAVLIETLARQKIAGVTVLMAAHRTGVLSVADKMMILRDGRIELFGHRDDVLAQLSSPMFQRPRPTAVPA